MPLTEVETQIVTEVLHRFLTEGKPTPRKPLVTKFENPDLLTRLTEGMVLRADTNRLSFLPMTLAFHYCADEDTLRIAKSSVEVVVRTLQELYKEAPADYPQFTPAEIETKARGIDPEIKSEAIQLGLYLAQEFNTLGGWSPNNPEGTEFKSVSVNEYILTRNAKTIWNERVQQANARLEPPTEQRTAISSSDRNILLSALRIFCNDAEMEDLLVHAHNIKAPRLNVGAGFELHVGWLLGLFGLSTVVLGKYEHIVAPETKVHRASVDILAADQSKNLMLLVACTLNPPKAEDFGNLRNAREIILREAFAGTDVRVIPVLFAAAMGCSLCNRDDSGDCVPIVDTDKMKELLGFLREGQEGRLFEFLANPDANTLPFFFPH
jgi:hypothetical protein